jgi:hypothetical protein
MVTNEEPQVWELYVHISFCELLAWQQCSAHAEVWIQHNIFNLRDTDVVGYNNSRWPQPLSKY